MKSCKGSQRPSQIRTSPVPWGPPWLCFSEKHWIGELKRLSSGWPADVKSSQTGYNDAAGGRLHPRLILQFVIMFSFAVKCSLHLNPCSTKPLVENYLLLVAFLQFMFEKIACFTLLKRILHMFFVATCCLYRVERCKCKTGGGWRVEEWGWSRGWGWGRLYCCKPVTKPGFETVIWQFQALGYVAAFISWVSRLQRSNHSNRSDF